MDIDSHCQLTLKNISKSCINLLNRNIYKLFGIVTCKKPILTRNVQTMGHYTAICLRVRETWIEYNDLEKKERNVKETSMITPALLIYIKEANTEKE